MKKATEGSVSQWFFITEEKKFLLWTHHDNILTQESPNVSRGILYGKPSSIFNVSLWSGAIIPVVSDYESERYFSPI